MKKYELITINEDELKNISLTEDELNSINSKLLKQIQQLSLANPNLNIDTSLPNVCETLCGESSKLNPSSYHCIPNESILIDLVLKAIEESSTIPQEDILFKGFFLTGGGNEYKLTFVNPGGFSYYYQVFLTKYYLKIYSLGLNFNLLNTYTIPLKEIVSSSIFNTLSDGTKLDHNFLTIRINSKVLQNINSFYFVSTNIKDDTLLNKFMSSLRSVNIKPFNRRFSKTTIYFYISMLFVLLYFIYVLFLTY